MQKARTPTAAPNQSALTPNEQNLWSTDLAAFLSEIHPKKVDLYLQMVGVFAEFERAMIQERVKAGLERARAQSKQLGRPTVSAEVEARIADLRGGAWARSRSPEPSASA